MTKEHMDRARIDENVTREFAAFRQGVPLLSDTQGAESRPLRDCISLFFDNLAL
jgi:hypothetical protein